MPTVRWDADVLGRPVDPLTLDALDGSILVLDGVTAGHDVHLGWVRRAPCVVLGATPEGAEPSSAVDVPLDASRSDLEAEIVERVSADPHAARTLVDVLRVTASLDVEAGLVLESLAYSMLLGGPEHQRWAGAAGPQEPRRHLRAPLVVDRSGDALTITLNRPEDRNAISAAMRDALFEALSFAAIDDTVESVVIRGDGPVFSSGGDLREFGTGADIVRAHEIRGQRSVGAMLHRLGERVRVHVHGACVGAGVELPAFARRVVADPGSTFRLPELSMGLIPGAGGTVSLTRRIGRQRTAELVLSGRSVGAAEALDIGLVDEIASRV